MSYLLSFPAAVVAGVLDLWRAGVLMFAPHKEYVSGLKWVGAGSPHTRLITSSYDGSLRALDVGAAKFIELPSPGG